MFLVTVIYKGNKMHHIVLLKILCVYCRTTWRTVQWDTFQNNYYIWINMRVWLNKFWCLQIVYCLHMVWCIQLAQPDSGPLCKADHTQVCTLMRLYQDKPWNFTLKVTKHQPIDVITSETINVTKGYNFVYVIHIS